jgi:hypothetical protein
MRDFHLILFVLALVTIDITFITIWVYYDPLEVKEVIFDELVRLMWFTSILYNYFEISFYDDTAFHYKNIFHSKFQCYYSTKLV